MDKKTVLLSVLVIAILALGIISIPGSNGIKASSENISQELDETNLSILREIGKCFSVDLSINVFCKKYDFAEDGAIDVLDATAFVRNKTLINREDATK